MDYLKDEIIEFIEWLREQQDGHDVWDEPEEFVDRYFSEKQEEE